MKKLMLLALAALLCAGCDDGQKKLEKAKQKYYGLVAVQKDPRDPAWDDVLKLLDEVNPDSKAGTEALQMRQAIETLRKPLPPRPLAVADETGGTDPLSVKKQQCANIAKALGLAREDQRPRVMEALQKCRTELEHLDVALAHEDEAADGGTDALAELNAAYALRVGDGGAPDFKAVTVDYCQRLRNAVGYDPSRRAEVETLLSRAAASLSQRHEDPGPCAAK